VLSDGSSIRGAVEQVKSELDKGNRVVVVVSALRGVTDQLINAVETIYHNTPKHVQDHIIRLGEEQSAILFTSALELSGVHSEAFTVDSPGWPIITNENFGNAEPIMEACQKSVGLSIRPVLERGVTPVVCGFVGRSQNGMITTLGRGGTDTTATVLASCLGADELVLVKDVGGVFTADPNLVPNSEMLSEISTVEAHILSNKGSKVLQNKVFRHKNPKLNIRIISKGEDFSKDGTVVNGDIPELDILFLDELVHEVSLIGENAINSQMVQEAVDNLVSIGSSLHGVEVNENYFSICFSNNSLNAIKNLHVFVGHHNLKAISLKENMLLVTIQGNNIEQIKSMIPKLLELPQVYRVCADSMGIILMIEQSAKKNIEEFFSNI
jgi:aspartate kinase